MDEGSRNIEGVRKWMREGWMKVWGKMSEVGSALSLLKLGKQNGTGRLSWDSPLSCSGPPIGLLEMTSNSCRSFAMGFRGLEIFRNLQ